jgi:hypothetical protein
VFAGKFGYEIAGTTAYSNSKHTNKDCAFCHMVKSPTNSAFGGHTFHVDEGTCNNCHNGAVNMETLASTFDTKLELLRSKLETKGLVSATGAVLPTHKSDGVTLVVGGLGRAWTNQEAGAVFNYLYSKEDASHGLHNPKYVMALLSNTIEMVDRW